MSAGRRPHSPSESSSMHFTASANASEIVAYISGTTIATLYQGRGRGEREELLGARGQNISPAVSGIAKDSVDGLNGGLKLESALLLKYGSAEDLSGLRLVPLWGVSRGEKGAATPASHTVPVPAQGTLRQRYVWGCAMTCPLVAATPHNRNFYRTTIKPMVRSGR